MLLIPDIHINTQYRDTIIQHLSDIVTNHGDEDHIILLGDYVYMFSYDRDALLALYKLIIARYHAGKTVYVLAGNHDWHGQHFVYEEARQAWDIINTQAQSSSGAIHFITTPQVFDIDGESILMMPYMIDRSLSKDILEDYKPDNPNTHHYLRSALTESSNKYEQSSGRLNLTLEYYTQTKHIDTIIHHYYTANTQFPGLRTQFSYRDVAIDPYWCNTGYDVISGHIHHPLVYGSYLCCGSIRTTAANETNQLKYYWTKHGQNIHGYQVQINPHLSMEHSGSTMDETQLAQHYENLVQEHTSALSSDHYHIELHHTSLNIQHTTISIITDHHHDVQDMIDPGLISALKSAKPKYKVSINHEHELGIDTDMLTTSVVQRKHMLTSFITSKYTDHSQTYLNILEELQIIDQK